LECVPNTSSIAKPPLFPSWSLVCLGSASLYSRKIGLRDMPNFTSGLHYLIPIDFYLTVNREKWEEDMKMIGGISRRLRKTTCENTRERVKLFIGFEFECLRGHRFIFGQKHLSNKMDSTSKLINLDIPLWLKCRCRRSSYAQLMRLHIVTPKAPVTVFINPRVQSRSTIFHTGEKPIGLEYSRYYVMRFPYIFGGSHGILRRQNDDYKMAKLLANSISVIHSPLN
uniref:Nonsense-mediated mRNA decay factor SMG8 n=1 Tax=Dracunculus medinensis TaxID=318479 RepID=A0A0N4UJJ6_DRAME